MPIQSIFPLFTTRCDSSAIPPPPPLLPPPGGSKSGEAGSTPPPPPPAAESDKAAAPPPPSPVAADDDIAKAAASVSSCPNPGPLEMATYDVRRLVSLDTYDGVRVDISKQLSPFFACVHSFHLGTTMLPDGKNCSYGFTTQMNDEEGFMMARVDPERGSVDGRIHKALLGGLAMGKLQLGLSSEGQSDQMLGEVDIGAATWTANLKYGSMGGGNVFGCNYFQAVTPKLAMGGEGMYIGANGNMLSSYTAKYSFDNGTEEATDAAPAPGPPEAPSYLAATYNAGQGMLSLNYKRAVTAQRVNIGASLECSPVTLESQVLLGAEFNLTRSKMNVCIDGSGRIQSVLETKLGREPGSPALNFAAELDHGKNVMKFGYGLNIGS
ncbi:Tom40 family protein [Skeletonema marinoi]|uniref:Tom40 family protein n=1 Tax=Skeletonema marinoi TaxID=267567 RepID=A0A7S2Q1S5_9STRA|nr:Tom40 family protein [Skeletonema marinoi]|mmetsp:Transcript_8010/g.13534  ORF Transcript_8010/g.13534 Transcript_8010/m.13534 type:complete len:381 (+) Transcript_8010:67-1209(+)